MIFVLTSRFVPWFYPELRRGEVLALRLIRRMIEKRRTREPSERPVFRLRIQLSVERPPSVAYGVCRRRGSTDGSIALATAYGQFCLYPYKFDRKETISKQD